VLFLFKDTEPKTLHESQEQKIQAAVDDIYGNLTCIRKYAQKSRYRLMISSYKYLISAE